MTGVQHKVVGVGFGLASSYIIVHGFGEQMGAICAATSAIGCMLPDIDHDMTKIGRKRKVLTNLGHGAANIVLYGGIAVVGILILLMALGMNKYGMNMTTLAIVGGGLVATIILRKVIGNSKTFKWATKHRGLMHTNVIPALLGLALTVSDAPIYRYSVLGLLIGYVSHLFADMMTVEGCPVLFPITKINIRILRLKTKDRSCTVCAWVLAIAAVAIAVVFF